MALRSRYVPTCARFVSCRKGSAELLAPADTPNPSVDDLDGHLKHVEAAGATIVNSITEHGFRSYTAADCEGRHWVFAQSGPRLGQ